MKIPTSKYDKAFLLNKALKNIKEFLPRIISNSFSGSSNQKERYELTLKK